MRLEGVVVSGRGLDAQWLPLEPGAITVLFGRNGAGKTTALESVAWAAAASSGGHEEEVSRLRDEPVIGPRLHVSGGFVREVGGALIARVEDTVPDRARLARILSPQMLDEDDDDAADLLALAREHYVEDVVQYSIDPYKTDDARRLVVALTESQLIYLSVDIGLAMLPSGISDDVLGTANRVADRNLDEAGEPEVVGEIASALVRGRVGRDERFRFLRNMSLGVDIGTEAALTRSHAPLDPIAIPIVLDRRLRIGEVTLNEEMESRIASLCLRILGVARNASHGRELADGIIGALERRANEIAPAFVLDNGALKVMTGRLSGLWQRERLALGIAPEGDGRFMPLELCGAGVVGWGAVSFRVALAELESSEWGLEDADGHFLVVAHPRGPGGKVTAAERASGLELARDGHSRERLRDALVATPHAERYRVPVPMPHVYLIDEPEQHLHLAALRDVSSMLVSLADTGAAVCTATHSPALLDLPDGRAHVVLAVPGTAQTAELDGGELVHALVPDHSLEPAVGPALSELRSRADELGIEPSSLVQFVRGFLFVEGTNDRWVLEHFFGRELNEAHVEVLALHGGSRAPGLAELELLWSLGKPVAVMLDNIRARLVAELRDGPRGTHHLHHEEQWLASLATSMRSKRVRLHLFGIEAPDIICAIPAAAIRQALVHLGKKGETFPGWRELRERSPSSLKRDFEAMTGASVDAVFRYPRNAGFDGPPSRELVSGFSGAMEYFHSSR